MRPAASHHHDSESCRGTWSKDIQFQAMGSDKMAAKNKLRTKSGKWLSVWRIHIISFLEHWLTLVSVSRQVSLSRQISTQHDYQRGG